MEGIEIIEKQQDEYEHWIESEFPNYNTERNMKKCIS